MIFSNAGLIFQFVGCILIIIGLSITSFTGKPTIFSYISKIRNSFLKQDLLVEKQNKEDGQKGPLLFDIKGGSEVITKNIIIIDKSDTGTVAKVDEQSKLNMENTQYTKEK